MVREYIEKLNPPVKLLIGYLLFALIGFIDYITYDVSFSIFYLIPISFVTWFLNRKLGILTAVIAAISWYYIEYNASAPSGFTNQTVPYWNALVRFGFFIIVVLLISKIRVLQNNLEETIKQRTLALLNEIEENKTAQNKILHQSSQLSMLYKRIESIREEQNKRIAREIHDELGQSLTGVNLEVMWIAKKRSNDTDLVERMHVISEIITSTISSIRKISRDLRPRLLDQLGLIAAIEGMVNEVQKRTPIKISMTLPEENITIDTDTSNTVYRIVQEAVTNTVRHSNCSEADIIIRKTPENLLNILIKDNGIGFNSEKAENGKTLGLVGMHERAKTINSKLEIITAENKGTEVELVVPFGNIQNGKHINS